MQNVPMDLLRTFVTAIDGGSFSRAADLVGRTPSAISLQIKRLEEIADTTLFRRDAHKLQLTPDGRTVAQFARRILALNDELLSNLRKPSVTGRVRLGAPHEYTASLLPEFLGKFAQAHPNVMLEVTSDLSKNLLRRQQAGEFDLVIALHEDSAAPGGRLVYREPLVWVGSVDHTSHLQSPLPLVLAPPPCIYRNRILQSLNKEQRACRVVYLSSSYNGISAAVRAGIGITVMAGSAIPPGSKIFAERDGLPNLGELELRIHRMPGSNSEALQRLEEYIAGSFANSVPARVVGLGGD